MNPPGRPGPAKKGEKGKRANGEKDDGTFADTPLPLSIIHGI
jgi:hypothetical protein